MSDNVTDMVPENRPTPAPSAGPPAAGGDAGDRHKAAPLWMVLGGLAAGLVAFAVGEMILNLIPPEKVAMRVMGRPVMAPSAATVRVAMTKNGTLTFGVFGACLAGFLGMAGGLTRRSTGGLVAAGLLGAILGLAVAAGASFGLLPFFLKTIPNHPDYDLTISALMHATIWGLAGGFSRPGFRCRAGRAEPARSRSGGRLRGGCAGGGCFRFDRRRALPLCRHRPADLDDVANPATGQAHDLRRNRRCHRSDSAPLAVR